MTSVLPSEISCGILIYAFCQKSKDHDGWDADILSKESQRKVLLSILKIMRNSEMDWSRLIDRIKATFPDDISHSFLKEVKSLEDADQLMNLFKALEGLVCGQNQTAIKLASQSNLIKRTSILGLFLRKLVLKFQKLSFLEVLKLLKTFQNYTGDFSKTEKQGLEESTVSENSNVMDLSCVDENTSDVSVTENEQNKENINSVKPSEFPTNVERTFQKENEKDNLTSRCSVFKFIEEHVNLLENDSLGGPEPHVLQQKLEEIQRHHANITDVYYLSFLNYLRVSEVNKASKMLCLYFDYKNFQSQPSGMDITEQEKHLTMFKRFRYGALNLGIMHCRHQNYDQAMTVLKEAVCIAQETNDEVCLKYAMFWIQVVKEETGSLSDSVVEARCCELIKEIYAEDEHVIDSIQDIECFSMLRCAKMVAFRGLRSPEFLLSNISRIVVSNSKVTDTALLTRSALLDFYGFKLLSLYNCQFPLKTLYNLKMKVKGMSEENLVIALCQLSAYFGAMCRYEEAAAVLDFILPRQPPYSCNLQIIQKCQMLIQFNQSVLERELDEAWKIAEFYRVHDRNESDYMKSVIDTVRGNYKSAFDRASPIHQTLNLKENCIQPMLKARVSLLLIELKLCSLNPAKAINDVLELCSLIGVLKTHSFSIDVYICLIRFLLKFGLHEKVLNLIGEAFVLTLANGTPHQQGLLYFLQGKCWVEKKLSESGNSTCKDEETVLSDILDVNEKANLKKQTEWIDIQELFDKAVTYFQVAKAKARLRDVYYEQAIVYHEMGLSQKRNSLATQFRVLNETLAQHDKCLLY